MLFMSQKIQDYKFYRISIYLFARIFFNKKIFYKNTLNNSAVKFLRVLFKIQSGSKIQKLTFSAKKRTTADVQHSVSHYLNRIAV